MADRELDLERGIPETGETRRRRRSSGDSDKPSASDERQERALNQRLIESLERIVEWRESREDEELATAIEQDKEKMARGLVSLTHAVTPLRQPLMIFLGFVEPVLAFGNVGRILVGRFVTRRQRIMEERAQAQAEWEAAQNGGNFQTAVP